MASLLEVLLTFVGVMLVLALAAQSVQEVIKIIFAIKGHTRFQALQGLIVDAATSNKLLTKDGEAIFRAVVRRLRTMGQRGVRAERIRLDDLNATQLRDLIGDVDTATIPAWKDIDPNQAQVRRSAVAEQAEKWFDLAMNPVAERYRRRMRGFALLSSAIVVLALNADALKVYELARRDPAFRARVAEVVGPLDSLYQRVGTLRDSITGGTDQTYGPADTGGAPQDTGAAETPGTTLGAQVNWADTLASVRATIDSLERVATGQEGFLVGNLGSPQPGRLQWWIGIALSTLLVSLGAPFWHDLLGVLFGWKKRIRAQASVSTMGRGSS